MDDDSTLIDHYGGGGLLAAIEAGLERLGKSPDTVTVDDLGPVDEFHVGGRPATVELCRRLELAADMDLLDVGCGIGGTARFVASTTGCRVTGLDLNPAFVEVARTLTAWTRLDDRVRFEAGSATSMPFDTDSFDRAVVLHVGMNIADKGALFAEIARVLRAGGRLGVYDLVRRGDGDIRFPVPWASEATQSDVADQATYETHLEASGFDVEVRDRREFALDFFARQQAASGTGPPPLGLPLIVGPDAPTKFSNLRTAIEDGVLAPVEFIGTRR